VVIDEVRCVFKNVAAKKNEIGLYPFEALKEIHNAIRDLGFGGAATQKRADETREFVNERWKSLRGQFLNEFERNEPDHPESKYSTKPNQVRIALTD
jgi:hypothetical protein